MADVYTKNLVEDNDVMDLCEKAIKASGMNIESCMYKKFKPHGLTAVWILSESHFTVHTYPENKYMSIDCYTCGTEGNPSAAIENLIRIIDAEKTIVHFLSRGA